MKGRNGGQLDAEQLTELRLFRGESPDALEWLLDSCSRRRLAPGEVLLEPLQHNTELYVVLRGSLVVRLKADGPVISTLGVGDCAGEMSILDSTNTSAGVAAEGEAEVMVIGAEALWSLITRSHVVSVNLLSILTSRVRSDNRVINKSLQLQDFYEYHARIDALTGLHNRRWLDETLARRTHESVWPLSLAMTDVDHFKRYNDTHGHLGGDAALRAVAGVVMEHLRAEDVAARYGGEEFVIVLPRTTTDVAVAIAERVRLAVAATPVRGRRGEPLERVTLSAGVATIESGGDAGTLLAAADAALYRAKHQGRDRVSR